MVKTLPRLSRKYLEQPQFITQSKFKEIADILDSKDRSYFKAAYQAAIDNDFELNKTECSIFEDYYTRKESGLQPQYGVLNVEGPLTYKPTGWEMMCGEGCNYTGLLEKMESFVDQGMTEVFMLVDSSGGEAYGMMETATALRTLADENSIKLIGYVDGISASAGYGLLSVCHEIISNPSAEVGSIGVVISLMNNSEQLKKEGLKRSFITAGASKVPFDAEGEFKDEFLEDLQGKVNVLYEQFTGHVATYRNSMSQDDVKGTEAKMFQSAKALELGLVDKVMELRDFKKEYLSGYTSDKKKDQKQKETLQMSDQNEVETPQFSNEQFEAMQAELAAYKAKEVEATKAKLTEQLESKPFLADSKDNLVGFFMNADISDDVKSLMNAVIASADQAMNTLASDHASALATVQEEADNKVQAAVKEAEKAKLESDQVKEEFATTEFSVKKETKEPKPEGKSNTLLKFLEDENA